MKYIIFGAGNFGRQAFDLVGADAVYAFADSNGKLTGTKVCGKEVLSFDKMMTLKDKYGIIVASAAVHEMEDQLIQNGIDRYDIFSRMGERPKLIPQNAGNGKWQEMIPYIQLRIVDHCNLCCKNCGSVCNSNVTPWSVSVQEYTSDVESLSKLFVHIGLIRILGGEPLLHPELGRFVEITRQYFPHSDIAIVTNGLLIGQLSEELLNTMKDNHISINISEYAPTSKIMPQIKQVLEKWDIPYSSSVCHRFHKIITSKADNDVQKSWENCAPAHDCLNFKQGKLYRCAAAEAFEKLNLQFGTDYKMVEGEDYIDVYRSRFMIRDIIKKFNGPVAMCRYCNDKSKMEFDWKPADGVIELKDYVITAEEYEKL